MSAKELPTHVAVIMDGNGRWAKRKNLPRLAGHNAGMKAMEEIVRCASDMGIKYLTVYAFSTENWKRSVEEVSGIFSLLVKFVTADLAELLENHVKMNIFGDYSKLPVDARAAVTKCIEDSKDNTGMVFNICLNYGSREEILTAAKRIAEEYKAGDISLENVDSNYFSSKLFTGEANIPDPDVIIRTSGEERLSNFLLWQAAYSEFVFTDELWPDFTPADFKECIDEYMKRDRRFGGRK